MSHFFDLIGLQIAESYGRVTPVGLGAGQTGRFAAYIAD